MAISKDEFALFTEIERNIADESEAREGYYRLLSRYDHLLDSAERAELDEIIAEELKHTQLLNAMIRRRNGIIAEQ